MALDCLQNNTAEQSVPRTNESENSPGSDGIIKRTPNLKGEHKKREELRKYQLLKDLQVGPA